MKLKFLFSFIAVCVFYINARGQQLTVQFNAMNEYAFNTREALNFTAINSSIKSFEIEFRGKISSSDGQTVVEFKTNPVTINPGANMISPMTVSMREQLYYNNDIAEIESKTGTYLSGNYSICIWSACIVQDCNGAGQSAGSLETPVCTQVHVENPTPLLLAFPENESVIEVTRPLYTWIPPAPVAGSASLNYTMTLVEVLEGQNKADALSLNRPLIDMQGIGNPILMHPSDLPALEAGKTYAWQVEAFVGRTSIAKSEQWKFKLKEKEKEKKIVNDMYVLLKINDKDIHHVTDTLKVLYKEFRLKDSLTFSFKNEKGLIVLLDHSKSSKYGENCYKFDLSGIEFEYKMQYVLTVTNSAGNRYFLKFIVLKS